MSKSISDELDEILQPYWGIPGHSVCQHDLNPAKQAILNLIEQREKRLITLVEVMGYPDVAKALREVDNE